jgi:hypothetical protein
LYFRHPAMQEHQHRLLLVARNHAKAYLFRHPSGERKDIYRRP